jgi:hypothetical protein
MPSSVASGAASARACARYAGAVEALVERRLDRHDERVHGHEVAALPALPDARLGHEVGVSRERGPRHRPEPLVERDVDAVEEAGDLGV